MSMVSGDYWALTVSLAPEAADAVSNFLCEAGATGVVEEGATPVALRAFFPPGSDSDAVGRNVTGFLSALRQLAIPVGPASVEVTHVPEEAWAEAWRAHFRPMPVGRRLLVCPPWEVSAAPPPGPDGPREVLVIEPGRAFGTGGHASTQGCLVLLERALGDRRARHVLDVGTGSGVLAIAAARLGADRVDALDLDPDAVASTVSNAARNGVAERVLVRLGTLETWAGPPADLVLANLLGAALVELAAPLSRRCAAEGGLILGGLLTHEVPPVVASYVVEGFELLELTEGEGWAALRLTRRR
jgi:ribosomal protein L11 methyltransferase